MRLPSRAVFAAVFVACAGLIGLAMYMQHELGLEPCPMCILQRYAFMAVALVALVAAIHGPGKLGVRIYGGLALLFALAGAGTSIRHSYLQRFPDGSLSCGADLDFLINNFSLAQALPKMFAGTGECSKVQWRMLGLSIPEWALVWYLIFAVVAIWLIVRKPS
ncbi:disulfide bond formation protein B [Usitatibacter palustris]|uniref:Disulfide bond formation protein B n=1 Tax=Usitatibacter palustris TaxID=2732487 RepID=A0A6M4HAD8_9PROT|nr:disulfide bond formation protein B [Usitatibacter palustris]QJR15818.1 Disulfide bond formation protein B [Usitatibacter palustris]